MEKIKCDRLRCEEKVFRGEHCCEGYDYAKTVLNGTMIFACPCACHKGITEEESIAKAKEFLSKIVISN